MGIDKNRFKCDIDNEVHVCSLCQEVFEDPVLLKKCQDSFCRKCLEQKLKEQNKCPIEGCGEAIGDGDWTNNKTLEKLLGKLQLTCSFASNGCDQVIALSTLSTHTAECRHNPDLAKSCGVCNVEMTDNHKCSEEFGKLKNEVTRLTAVVDEKQAKIVELEKALDESRKRSEDFEKLQKMAKNNNTGDNYMVWLSKFAESGNEAHRRYVEGLKEKKLITDWRMEAVLMRLEPINGLSNQLTNYYEAKVPKVLSALKDNLQPGSSVLISQSLGCYLIHCCALMVGPTGHVFTDYISSNENKNKNVNINLDGEKILNQITSQPCYGSLKTTTRLYKGGVELTHPAFDCVIGDFRQPLDLLPKWIKVGGRAIFNIKVDSFGVMEKLANGSVNMKIN